MAGSVTQHIARERERKAWERRVKRHWTEQQIADDLGVTQQAVSLMLSRVKKRFAKELKEQIEQMKAEQTAQHIQLAQEAEQAWARSQQPAEIERTVVKKTPQGTETHTTSERRGQSGDPRFLSEMREALSAIRDIWGLDAPKKTDLTSDGQPVKALIGVDPELM